MLSLMQSKKWWVKIAGSKRNCYLRALSAS